MTETLSPFATKIRELDREGHKDTFSPYTNIPDSPPFTREEQSHAQRLARIQLLFEAERDWHAAETEARRLEDKIWVRPRTARQARANADQIRDEYNALSSITDWFFNFQSDGGFIIFARQRSNNNRINGQPMVLTREVFLDGEILEASSPQGKLTPKYAENVHRHYRRQIAAGRRVYERSFSLSGRVGSTATPTGAKR